MFSTHIASVDLADEGFPLCYGGLGAMMMSCDDGGTKAVQRFEVFTGAGRRRIWSVDDKAGIVADSFSGRETVSAVARRYGLSPSQLFAWRRQARDDHGSRGFAESITPMFVPAVLAPPLVGVPEMPLPADRPRASCEPFRVCAVELEIGGVPVRISHDADAGVITAVINALKAQA